MSIKHVSGNKPPPKNAEENKKTRKVSTEQTLDNNKGTLVALVALAALVALVA